MAAAGMVVVIVGLTLFLVLRPTNVEQAGPASPASATQTGTRTTQDSTSQTTPTTEAVTQADLQQEVAADRSVADELVGFWVPQISSKRLGLLVHGVTFDYPAILADFRTLWARFPQSVLIRSDDYSSYPDPGYWVTVVAQTYETGDAANAWCDANGLAAEDCFAHRLSHTDGPAGNSEP